MGKIREIDLESYDDFFREFTSLESRLSKGRIESEKHEFSEFRNRYIPFDLRIQELLKRESPFYNIFEILNIRHRETKLHTPFLVNLLNPEGSHGQGSLFLDSLLSQLMSIDFVHQKMDLFEIHEEYANDKGQLDILIRFTIHGSHKAIVIENKIYAGDQDIQLDRYKNYLLEGLKLDLKDIWLVYLTPSGKRPSKESLDLSIQQFLRKNNKLIELSYHRDIIPWLRSCKPKILSIRVKETIDQYIKTLESL